MSTLGRDPSDALSAAPDTTTLTSGTTIATLGLGTWRLGESRASAAREVSAVCAAIDIGYRLFDTAEMYGEGGAERILGKAIGKRLSEGGVARDELCVVSKVYPHNAGRKELLKACDRSRSRLGLDCVDVYLLHWRGDHPLGETVEAFETLRSRGAIGHWGVSNFDVEDLDDLWRAEGTTAATTRCATNQVYYSLASRGPEFALLPHMRAIGMPLMAYTPLLSGTALDAAALVDVARERGVTPTQISLAWVLSHPGVIAIPKAIQPDHLQQNWDAARIGLTDAEIARIDTAFPPPRKKGPLAMI